MKQISEIKALISLADEPDNLLFQEVRRGILNFGTEALPHLEEALKTTSDPFLIARITSVSNELRLSKLIPDLKNWKKSDKKEILDGYRIVHELVFPESDKMRINREIERMVQVTFAQYNPTTTPLEKVRLLNHFFFHHHRFVGGNYESITAESFDLENVFVKRKGNALVFGVLYQHLANCLQIPIVGVNVPYNFCLAYVDERFYGKENFNVDEHILFYINPNGMGNLISPKGMKHFLNSSLEKVKPEYYTPCSKETTINQVITTLGEIFLKNNQHEQFSLLSKFRTEFL